MIVRVEFYGIPRLEAGIDQLELELPGERATLGQVLDALGHRLPQIRSTLLANGQLASSCLASVNGDQFVRDLQSSVHAGQSLLLLSSDAGG